MLEFNGTAIVLAISFIIFVVLENFIFYRPLKKTMDERAQYIAQNETSADEDYSAANILINKKDEKIADAQGKSSEILNATAARVQEEFDNTVKNLKTNSNKSVDEMKAALVQEKVVVKDNLKNDIGAYASEIISKILKKDVSVVNVNDDIVDRAMRGEL